MKINKLIIDSSNSITDLCKLGVKNPTDKSAYVKDDLHRHAYMAIYDLLFMNLRYKNIKFTDKWVINWVRIITNIQFSIKTLGFNSMCAE